MFGAILAAIMAASFFLPWVVFFGDAFGPQMLIEGNQIELANMPWQLAAFLASFAVAALAAVLALLGRAAGVLMLIAGGIPYGIIAHGIITARGEIQDLGLPLPDSGNPMEAFNSIRDFIDVGLPAYFISAALLVVVGLVRMVRGA